VVFLGCLREPHIVNANFVAVLHPGWDKLVPLILDYSESCLFWHNMDETDPLII